MAQNTEIKGNGQGKDFVIDDTPSKVTEKLLALLSGPPGPPGQVALIVGDGLYRQVANQVLKSGGLLLFPSQPKTLKFLKDKPVDCLILLGANKLLCESDTRDFVYDVCQECRSDVQIIVADQKMTMECQMVMCRFMRLPSVTMMHRYASPATFFGDIKYSNENLEVYNGCSERVASYLKKDLKVDLFFDTVVYQVANPRVMLTVTYLSATEAAAAFENFRCSK